VDKTLSDSTENRSAPTDFFEERVWVQTRDGRLEAELIYDPMAAGQDAVMLLSPHPNFAGTMDNNVVLGLSRHLGGRGFAVFRFNYPGVGASSLDLPETGSSFDYWDTVEKEQRFEAAVLPSREALAFFRRALGSHLGRIHLVGYSFGAVIALILAADEPGIQSVTAISMPWISRYRYGFLAAVPFPKYFISGDRDFAFEPAVFDAVWPRVCEPKGFHLLDNDHFFRNAEALLADMVIKNLV
jgi:alpha/beta superfamily hydrolase